MAKPNSRQTFKDYCLRRLGAPVINIEVDDEQIDDRIDDALNKYRDYHYDGTERVYYKIRATEEDVARQYFVLPDDINGVIGIFRIGSSPNISNLFNIRYQIHLNDLFDFSSATYTPYVMAMRHIETLEELFIGQTAIRFNRHNNLLYCDLKWGSDVTPGTWIIVDGYRTMNPDEYVEVWNDPWLKKYATALIKQQWGENLKKFEGTQLLGGVAFSGQQIWNEANEEIEKLEADVINSYSLPSMDMTN
jgi:hypothetical protein